MRVLLVEDQSQYAGLVAERLTDRFAYDVTLATDPLEAERYLISHKIDVVVIDVLYERFIRDFDSQRLARLVTLDSSTLLISGLRLLHLIDQQNILAKPVLWTAGDSNRQLHIVFAYEEFGVRSFCSKGARSLDTLDTAITQAAAGSRYVDPILKAYLSSDRPLLKKTILREQQRRAVWRSLAFGYHSRPEISRATHYSQGHIGNLVSKIYSEDLTLLDPGLPEKSRSPLNDLVRYAAQNWEFLLDDTVRALYP